jgi:hypothetical protein
MIARGVTPLSRGAKAQEILAQAFAAAGWNVQREKTEDQLRIDLQVSRGAHRYAVEVKAAPEGRVDRLVPLWSQACLQAQKHAPRGFIPLAVVAAPRIREGTAEQLLDFALSFAPDVAIGVIDLSGLRRFRGSGLEGLDSDPAKVPTAERSIHSQPTDLFSDLNQWMLKVLLAPELPEHLLSAPRDVYSNASQLARAAGVSVMTANRFVRLLRKDGFLDEPGGQLSLVRREDLFRRWRGSASRRIHEVPMRFLLRANPKQEIARIMKGGRGCLALFAAAEALNAGFVQGVPPHVFMQRLGAGALRGIKNLVPAGPGESPDVTLRQAASPHSIFRGAVEVGDLLVSDVLQIWVDVSNHASRGEEQAHLIRRRILEPLIRPEIAHG